MPSCQFVGVLLHTSQTISKPKEEDYHDVVNPRKVSKVANFGGQGNGTKLMISPQSLMSLDNFGMYIKLHESRSFP